MARSRSSFDIYSEWQGGGYMPPALTPKDKESNARAFVRYMFARAAAMFEWKGLPDTIPAHSLERILQTCGEAIIADVRDSKLSGLYAFPPAFTGDLDVYFRPTKAIVTNHALATSHTYTIGTECVRVPNDSSFIGLYPIFSKYGAMLAENELSIQTFDVVTRLLALIVANDDNAKADAETVLKKIEKGELGVILGNMIYDGIKTSPLGTSSTALKATDYIEIEQYLKASAFNEIGIDANFNMKREALNSSESSMNDAALLPLVDDMLKRRKMAAREINELFGLNVTVELASVWEDQQVIADGVEPTKGGDDNDAE